MKKIVYLLLCNYLKVLDENTFSPLSIFHPGWQSWQMIRYQEQKSRKLFGNRLNLEEKPLKPQRSLWLSGHSMYSWLSQVRRNRTKSHLFGDFHCGLNWTQDRELSSSWGCLTKSGSVRTKGNRKAKYTKVLLYKERRTGNLILLF